MGPIDRRGARSQKPRGGAPRATAVRLASKSREDQSPQRPPWGWALEAEWGRAPCDRHEAGLEKPRGGGLCDRRGACFVSPRGAGRRATAVGLAPRSRKGQGPVRPPRGWASCDHRGAGP